VPRRKKLFAVLEQELPGVLQEGEGGTACVLPKSTTEVAQVVRIAAREKARLAPPGGIPREGTVPLDLRRMGEVIAVDDTSHLVHVEGGVRVATLEVELRRRHLTLGIEGTLPDESVAAWLAQGAPGGRDHRDDPVDQLVAGLEAVLADGRKLDIRPAPRRAVGPDLVAALVGSRGRLGVITGAHLVARALTDTTDLAFRMPTRQSAEAAREWIRGRGVRPASAVLAEADGEVVLRLRLEGLERVRKASMAVARRTVAEHGGVEIDAGDAPSRPRPTLAETSDIVRQLAERLDAAGVFA